MCLQSQHSGSKTRPISVFQASLVYTEKGKKEGRRGRERGRRKRRQRRRRRSRRRSSSSSNQNQPKFFSWAWWYILSILALEKQR